MERQNNMHHIEDWIAGENDSRFLSDEKANHPRAGDFVLPVEGAGYLSFGKSLTWRCGRATGVSIDCSWTRWGFCGGVLDKSHVRLLHAYLTKLLEADNGENITDAADAGVVP